jgi:hypothetical protein
VQTKQQPLARGRPLYFEARALSFNVPLSPLLSSFLSSYKIFLKTKFQKFLPIKGPETQFRGATVKILTGFGLLELAAEFMKEKRHGQTFFAQLLFSSKLIYSNWWP